MGEIMNKSSALVSLRPGAEWVLRGDELEWMDAEQTQPSDSEIQTEITRLEKLFVYNEYQRDRASEYPSWQDQLDDIFHNGLEHWKSSIQAVKTKYPKP
jgi:hypothetical protein